MKQSMKCAVAVMLSFLWMNAPAQFYTVQSVGRDADTLSLSTDPYVSDVEPKANPSKQAKEKKRFRLALPFAKLGTKTLPSNLSQEKPQEKVEKSFSIDEKKVEKQMIFPLLSTNDSLIVELIKKRITLCMPLDFVQINSQYGYRRDPFTKCSKFHDGIDLQGIHDLVYSMLPGRIVEVRHGNTGYGNYVVLDHGSLRCLYGHLSEIYAKEGSIVDAGTIVGRVGSTGRSTGTHLHIRLQHIDSKGDWRSVDPFPFISALNQQVNEYNDRISELTGQRSDATHYYNSDLTIENLYAALKKHGIKFPKIVLAQAILETGNFKSRLCKEQNNLFGLRHSKGYYSFDHWEESVIAYRDWVQYKHRKGEEYYTFLRRINYASSRNYVYKVREIAENLTGKL
jgi:murein DD-endopeptidase MepM/ murein hydrolase activator NlpD